VLGRGVDPDQLEPTLADFLAVALSEGSRFQRGSMQVCLDGKTLRGTHPLGESQGVHSLSADVPKQEVV
jgi:hypothetical protein